VALVTGAASGLGRSIVHGLRAAGFLVVAADLAGPPADSADPSPGPRDEADPPAPDLSLKLDVTDRAAVERTADLLARRFERLDVLVNNAGVFAQTPALDLPEDRMLAILDVNLAGALRCTAAFGRLMSRRRSGRIINVASISGLAGAALASVYAASKAGLIAATRSVARELAPYGIAVNAVAPGFCDTPMLDPHRAVVERFTVPRIPAGRLARPDEVSAVVRYLALEAPPYQTGSVIVVDGGLTCA
jgi:3-oxoacyl-[acyl-carrier protein] reductase